MWAALGNLCWEGCRILRGFLGIPGSRVYWGLVARTVPPRRCAQASDSLFGPLGVPQCSGQKELRRRLDVLGTTRQLPARQYNRPS